MPIANLSRAGLLALAAAAFPAAATDWPQFGFDAVHSGNNTAEHALGAGNVSQLAAAWADPVVLPAKVDGAPVYAAGIATPGGTRNLLFLFGADAFCDGCSSTGTVFALDGDSGEVVWSRTTTGSDQHASSSPAIDAARAFVYSFGLDGYVHKYAIGTGEEVLTAGPTGWPQRVTLKPDVEKVARGLAIFSAGGHEYLHAVTNGYNGDGGDYQGHSVAIDLGDGTQKIFNAMCSTTAALLADGGCPSGRMSGIWGRGGSVYDADTGRVYVTTGNGQFNANSSGHNWGDSVLALATDGSGSGGGLPLDSYTPSNYQSLDNSDADLGSVSLAIVPVPPGSAVAHAGVQTGKDGVLRLIDLDDMSGAGAPAHVGGEIQLIDVPRGGAVFAQPAVWLDPSDQSAWIYVANGAGLSALQLGLDGNNRPHLTARWDTGGSTKSPVLANGVLYSAGACPGGGTCVSARNPRTGDVLWSSPHIGNLHWESPIVVDGALYMADGNGQLWKFALPATDTVFADGFDG